ncbi:MAG: alpha/beta hydrolase, partial [Myxococcota bacterium]
LGSGAALMPALVEAARAEGRDLTVVAMDHPSNAYADRVEASSLGDGDEVALDFLDAFLIAFVHALDGVQSGASTRIEAILGGSLGGNLVLRLAQREDLPWVRRVVAWSPASVDFSWSRAQLLPFGDGDFLDVIKHEAVRLTRDASRKREWRSSRREYFTDGLLGVRTQAGYWYRDGWDVCKPLLIEEGLRQLSEVYDRTFRRWHYRLAFEQLLFSHIEMDDEGVRPFERIRAPLLLFTGEGDNSVPMATWSFIERLAPHLVMPGETLFLRDTGHAMHSERPELMAREIFRFLGTTSAVAQ